MTDQTNTNGNAIVKFGQRDEIREMSERLVKMMPGTTKLTPTEALTVAQIAIAHGLDPFTGEVWGLKGENDKWYGTMIGIAGRRKKSREQAEKEGGTYWTEPPMRVEPKTYGQPETAVVYEIRLRDTVSTQAYAKSLHSLTTAGIPYKEAIEMIGKAPVWVGVGIATADERSKMNIHARAKKRAENDALKQRYDISLVGIDYSEGDQLPSDAQTPEFIDAQTPEFIDAQVKEYEPPTTQPEAPKKTEQQLLAELGFN